MQTFLPYSDFSSCAAVLDTRRLGKQRVEAYQILRALTFTYYGWKHSVTVRMWRGFVPALVSYGVAVCDEWSRRGHAEALRSELLEFFDAPRDMEGLKVRGLLPPWLGFPPLHVSHRSSLVRKDPEHYRTYFPDVPDDLPYVWPADIFPRWPIRRCRRRPMQPLPLDDAVAALGLEAAMPGQRATVAALRDGGNVLLVAPPGSGGSSTALIAGLALPGPTVWFTPGHSDLDDVSVSHAAARPAAPRSGRARSRPSPSIAREPSADDLKAMRAGREAAPDFHFYRPPWLEESAVRHAVIAARPGLVVVADPLSMPPADLGRVRDLVGDLGSPPLLTVVAREPAPRQYGLLDRVTVVRL